MRRFVIVLLLVGMGVVVRQKQNHRPPSANAATQAAAPSRAPASQPNYMKRALDQAREVREKARAHTLEVQNP
jgi:hypothetical protein